MSLLVTAVAALTWPVLSTVTLYSPLALCRVAGVGVLVCPGRHPVQLCFIRRAHQALCACCGGAVCGIAFRYPKRRNVALGHSRRRAHMAGAVHRHLVQPAGPLPCSWGGCTCLPRPSPRPAFVLSAALIRPSALVVAALYVVSLSGIPSAVMSLLATAVAALTWPVPSTVTFVQPAGPCRVAGVGVVVGVFGNAVQLRFVRRAHQAVCALRCHIARLCFNGTFGCRFCAGCRRLRLAYGGLAGLFPRRPCLPLRLSRWFWPARHSIRRCPHPRRFGSLFRLPPSFRRVLLRSPRFLRPRLPARHSWQPARHRPVPAACRRRCPARSPKTSLSGSGTLLVNPSACVAISYTSCYNRVDRRQSTRQASQFSVADA